MVSKILFFCLCVNHPLSPHFKAKILLHFEHANEASQDDWHRDGRIIIAWLPFMNTGYNYVLFIQIVRTILRPP